MVSGLAGGTGRPFPWERWTAGRFGEVNKPFAYNPGKERIWVDIDDIMMIYIYIYTQKLITHDGPCKRYLKLQTWLTILGIYVEFLGEKSLEKITTCQMNHEILLGSWRDDCNEIRRNPHNSYINWVVVHPLYENQGCFSLIRWIVSESKSNYLGWTTQLY